MSDDKGKKAGAISKFKQQYGQIGGGKASERLDSEGSSNQDSTPLKSQTIEPSKHLDSQESKTQDSELSNHSAIQPSKRQDIQQSNHPASEDVKQPDSQPSKPLNSQPLEHQDKGASNMPDITTVEQPSTQKHRSKQQRDKLTVYLEPELNDWIRQQVIIEKRRRGHHVEISDIINEALQKMRDNQ
jgi:hypothetical protein